MLQKQRFIFLLKARTVTPQSLEDAEAGEVIRSALSQNFYLSRIHVLARNSREALEKFQQLTEFYANENELAVIVC